MVGLSTYSMEHDVELTTQQLANSLSREISQGKKSMPVWYSCSTGINWTRVIRLLGMSAKEWLWDVFTAFSGVILVLIGALWVLVKSGVLQ